MGIFLNPGNALFKRDVNKRIYVDKSKMIAILNDEMCYGNQYVCVSRPRRFGKSVDANMLVAYYSKECDSHPLFDHLKIAQHDSYERHLNQHNMIHLNMHNFLSSANTILEMIQKIEKYLIVELKRFNVELLFDDDLTIILQEIYTKT